MGDSWTVPTLRPAKLGFGLEPGLEPWWDELLNSEGTIPELGLDKIPDPLIVGGGDRGVMTDSWRARVYVQTGEVTLGRSRISVPTLPTDVLELRRTIRLQPLGVELLDCGASTPELGLGEIQGPLIGGGGDSAVMADFGRGWVCVET